MLKFSIPATLLAISAAVHAVPGGPIDVLAPAAYRCEMPGDAAAAAGYRVPGEDFEIANSTSYIAAGRRGTYLLTGNLLVLTSGPKRGQKFNRISSNFLRKLDADGQETALRCVRRVINNTGGQSCTDPETGVKPAGCKAAERKQP